MLVLSLPLNENACFFAEWTWKPHETTGKLFRRKKSWLFPSFCARNHFGAWAWAIATIRILRNSWTWSWIWSWRSMRTVKKKLNSNPDDASDHFLSAKRLHTRPSSCSTRARLVAPCNYNSTTQIKELRPNATGIYMTGLDVGTFGDAEYPSTWLFIGKSTWVLIGT